jgi:hypothetical protein
LRAGVAQYDAAMVGVGVTFVGADILELLTAG